jgi:hypothetical protein
MRVDQSTCRLTVNGREMPMTFSKREGGELSAGGSKYRPAGNMPEKAQGGPGTVENVTLAGEYEPELHSSDFEFLRASLNAPCVVVEQHVGAGNAAVGAPKTWTGLLEGVNEGEYDANSTDTREFEIEINTDGVQA